MSTMLAKLSTLRVKTNPHSKARPPKNRPSHRRPKPRPPSRLHLMSLQKKTPQPHGPATFLLSHPVRPATSGSALVWQRRRMAVTLPRRQSLNVLSSPCQPALFARLIMTRLTSESANALGPMLPSIEEMMLRADQRQNVRRPSHLVSSLRQLLVRRPCSRPLSRLHPSPSRLSLRSHHMCPSLPSLGLPTSHRSIRRLMGNRAGRSRIPPTPTSNGELHNLTLKRIWMHIWQCGAEGMVLVGRSELVFFLTSMHSMYRRPSDSVFLQSYCFHVPKKLHVPRSRITMLPSHLGHMPFAS